MTNDESEDHEVGQEGEQSVEVAVARDGLGPGFDGGKVRQETEVRRGEGRRMGVVGITAGGGGRVHNTSWLSVHDFAAPGVTLRDATGRERRAGSAPRWLASDWWHRSIARLISLPPARPGVK